MRTALLLGLIAFVFPSPVSAQPLDPPQYSTLELDVLCDVTAPTELIVTLGISAEFGDRTQGFVMERSVVGSCNSSVRLDPIQLGVMLPGRYELHWTDETAQYGVAYQYRVRYLDANGDDVVGWAGFDIGAPLDYATCGGPILAHGTISSSSLFVETCPEGCWSMFTVDRFHPLLAPYVDTGTPLEIRGTVHCQIGNVEGCSLTVESVTPAPCEIVPVEPNSWGALKSRF